MRWTECAVNFPEDRGFRRRIERIESLVRDLEHSPDTSTRECAQEIIQTVLELHGTALERMLESITHSRISGPALIDSIAEDELVASVLLLHGIHPLDLDTRVRQALDSVRPLLRSHKGDVELIGLTGGVVRLRMLGSCDGCPSSALTLKTTVEEAIVARAPDVTGIEVEGTAGNDFEAPATVVQIALPVIAR
jgi:Fe-S cluster biogenesis protein NfuA